MGKHIKVIGRSNALRVIDYHCDGYPHVHNSTPEIHNTYTLIIPYAGHFHYKSGNKNILVDSTKLIFGNAGDEYLIYHDKDIRDKCYAIEFTENIIKNIFNELVSDTKIKHGDFVCGDRLNLGEKFLFRSARLSHIIKKFFPRDEDESSRSLELTSAGYELFAELLKEISGKGQIESSGYKDAVGAAKYYITNNFTENLSLENISSHIGISPFHLIRVFKSETGITPHQFIIESRINFAKQLLRDTTQSISEICFECGFNNIGNFSTTFKRLNKNTSPSEYRKIN